MSAPSRSFSNSCPLQTDSEKPGFAPLPIDTSSMVLPESIVNLRDVVAENLHELWSYNKIEAGWSYAETRDDVRKKHPCLTTYEMLTDVERDYDITLTMETLK